jgi:predicted AAA+ superfamily ATPase
MSFGYCYDPSMEPYIDRAITRTIKQKLKKAPAVAILGPRQCGKTTLAHAIISEISLSVYLDLERRSDLNKLQDPEMFFKLNDNRLICLDEIQRVPELFPEMRSKIDRNGQNGQFLILGSASPELLKQTSETLAGRIAFVELTPFLLREISKYSTTDSLGRLWLRGGFPRSYLSETDMGSYEWRLDFIRTFLERDIPQLGINIPSLRLERFWQMCAHTHGQLLNRSSLGESLGVSHHTINNYVALLEKTYMLRVLRPYYLNTRKRLIKSPKIYIRDSGLVHALLSIETHNDLLGHPVYGASWEGFVMETIINLHPGWRPFFYRSVSGAEIDLVLEKGDQRLAIIIKASTSPNVNRGFWNSLTDLSIEKAYVVAPVDSTYPLRNGIQVMPLSFMEQEIISMS